MGLFGKIKLDRYGLKPSDLEAWQMDPMTIDQPDIFGQGGASGGGTIQGDTEVTREKLPGYFAGGDKFTGRDALAGVLAAIGDVFTQRSGGQPMAMENLTGGRLSALKLAQEAQQRQLEREQGLQDYEAKQQIDQRYAAPAQPPAMARNYQWWDSLPAEEKAKFAQMQSVVNPKWMTGADGVPRQMTGGGLPQGYDPGEWEVVDDQQGGGSGNATGGFPPRYRR